MQVDHQLKCELLYHISSLALLRAKREENGTTEFLYHDAISAYESAYSILSFAPGHEFKGGSLCRRVVPVERLRDELATRLGTNCPQVPELVETLVGLWVQVGGVPLTRKGFVPVQEYEELFDHFAKHDFVIRFGACFEWSDKIAPAMQAAYAWNSELESFEDLVAVEVESEARLLWQNMPSGLKTRILESHEDAKIDFLLACAVCWDGSNWNDQFASIDSIDFIPARLFRVYEQIVETFARLKN